MVDVKRSLVKLTVFGTFLLTALACPAQVMTAGALLLGEDSLKLLMTAISGVSAGNVANAIDALTQGKDPDVVSLQNEDVTRAVGRAIAAVISQAAEQYPGETKNQLNKIAAQAKDHWVSLWLSFVKQERYSELNETQLPEVLIPTETHLTQETILGIEEWKDIFIRLNMAACPGGGFSLPPEVYQQVAKLLYTTFPKSLRESLKDDFAKDGKAFAGLAIQLLAGTRAALGKLQEDQKHEFSSVLEHFQKLESLLKPLQDIPTIKDNTDLLLQGQQEQTDKLSQILDCLNSKTTEKPDLKLYKALLKLDYSKQQSLFEEFVNHHQIGACLIHGSEKCGPRWLMNRLIQQVPNGGPDKYEIKISFSRTTQNGSLESICKEISRKIGISSTAIPEIAQKICQLWRSQTVILIFDNTHNLDEAYLEKFLEKFWQPIADLAKQTGTINYNYRLVLFLLDLEGYTNDWEIPYTQEITPEWHPRTLIKFKEIEPISPVELSGWLEQHLCDQNLPPKPEIVEKLLETSQGNHQYIMEELCQRCNITWEEQESKWLKY